VKAPEGLVPAGGVCLWETGERVADIRGIARFHPFDPENPKIETSAKSGDEVAAGRVESDGTFVVHTSRLVDGETHEFPGISPGQYKVMLYLLPAEGGLPHINPDYQHPVRTPLIAKIRSDQSNYLELKVDRHYKGWSP
jgi:hypothetical protein